MTSKKNQVARQRKIEMGGSSHSVRIQNLDEYFCKSPLPDGGATKSTVFDSLSSSTTCDGVSNSTVSGPG